MDICDHQITIVWKQNRNIYQYCIYPAIKVEKKKEKLILIIKNKITETLLIPQ
jgi:hypothetical protein